MDEQSDPNIVSRLKGVPPFEEEEQETPEVQEEVQEEPQEEEQQEEVVRETPKDRTSEQFDKLKEHNAQLKKELEEAKAKAPTQNALESLYPKQESPVTNVIPSNNQYPGLSNKEVKDAFANLTDDQGYVDTGLLKETLSNLQKAKEEAERVAKEANERAQRVERKQDDFERKQIMREVHKVFPKLDPENATSDDPEAKFSQTFYDMFQGEIMRQWTAQGTADPMKVAEKVHGILYPMKKVDREKLEKAEMAKRNISASSVKPASTHDNYTDHEDLVQATRMGKKGALAERLRRAEQ